MKSKMRSFKNLIILLLPVIIVLIYLVNLKQDIKLDDKWISINEIKEQTPMELDNAYFYCDTYENIKNDKYNSVRIILCLWCIVISLIIFIVLLYSNNKKQNIEKFKKNIIKSEKNKEIVSKFSSDEQELKVQQILNDDFKFNIYNKFCDLQNACMNNDYKVLQKLLTRELYNKYCTGLAISKYKCRKNIVEDIELINIKYVEVKENEYKYSIKVQLKVKYYGYVIDSKSNKVVKGTKNNKITNVYMLNLVKHKNINNCPNCLAPIPNNVGRCEYCKTIKTVKNTDWLIDEKEKINEN